MCYKEGGVNADMDSAANDRFIKNSTRLALECVQVDIGNVSYIQAMTGLLPSHLKSLSGYHLLNTIINGVYAVVKWKRLRLVNHQRLSITISIDTGMTCTCFQFKMSIDGIGVL